MKCVIALCLLAAIAAVYAIGDEHSHGSKAHAASFVDTPVQTQQAKKEIRRYDGYQVVRVKLPIVKKNITSALPVINMLHTIAELQSFDVWATNLKQGWMDIMIPPSAVPLKDSLLLNLPNEVTIEDVQKHIEENEKDRAANRAADFFSDFRTYGAISTWLEGQARNATSTIVQRISIGSSNEGTHIYGLQMTKSTTPRPAMVIQCGIHAREWITPTTCCWIIDQFLNKDTVGQQLLNSFQIIVIPVLNVDGFDYTHTSDRMWRKNTQANEWSPCMGTDLNRNYAYSWGTAGASSNPCSETFYGSAAFSGTEVAAIRDFLEALNDQGRLVSYFDIHAYSALWMSPWGYTCRELPSDYKDMNETMTAAVEAVASTPAGHSYDYGAICPTIYQSSGSSIDYSYGALGVIDSYAVEAFGNSFTAPVSYIPVIGQEIYLGVRETATQILGRMNKEKEDEKVSE